MLCYVFWSQVEYGIVYFISIENIENSTSTSRQNGHNLCMEDVIIMKFGQNVQNNILFTYL